MDDLEVSSSRFAWSWLVEVLATHRNVNLQYLQDLIQYIPELSDKLNKELSDKPYKQTIEVIALRNLEWLFDPAMVSNSGVLSSSDQEDIHFDSSESPSHVLKRVMELPSMSNLRKDGDNPIPNVRKCYSDKLVREVYSYIQRKKASMPESSLQELSDILQKGDVHYETDLECERSCLKTQELVQNSTLEAQSGESPPKTQLIYDMTAAAEKSTSSLISSDMQDCPIDNRSDKFLPTKKRRHNGNASVPSKELKLAPLISPNMPDCPVDDQSDKFLPTKKRRHNGNASVPSKELKLAPSISPNMPDCPVDDQSDKFLPTKKRRHNGNDSVPSKELKLAPSISPNTPDCPVNDQSDNFQSGKKCRDSGNGSVPCAELKTTSSISSDMQDCPVDVECGLSPPGKKLRHDSNNSSFSEKKSAEKNCPVDSQNGNSPPEKQSHDSSGSVASTEKNSDPSISSDNNQPFPLSPKPAQPTGPLRCWPSDVLNEIKKSNAENSSSPPDVTELDICIKCCKDGEVLFCRGSSCPIVIHERCLGITTSIDNRDNFLCPFCICSLAKSKYTEAKERMLVAREKLTLFVGGNPDNQPKESAEVDANPSRLGRVDGAFKGKGIYRVDQSSTDKQRDAHLARVNVHSSTPKCLSEQAEGVTGNCRRASRQFSDVNTSSSRKFRDERKFKEKMINLVGLAPADKQHEGHIEQETVHTSPPKSIPPNSCQTEKRFVLVNAFPPTDEQKSDHLAPDNEHYLTDEQAFTDENGKDVHQAHQASKYEQHNSHLAQDNVHDSPPTWFLKEGEDKTEKTCQLEKGDRMIPIEKFHYAGVSTRQHLDRVSKKASRRAKISDNFLSPQSKRRLADLQDASTATLDDCDVISEEENSAATTSRLPQSFKNMERKSYRTNRVPWTEKEVEMLKEGVKRFGSGNVGVMPWSMILEFGTGVFWKGRTGGNLKDKWRNLLKANPELR